MVFGQKKTGKDGLAMEVKPDPTKKANMNDVIGIGLTMGTPNLDLNRDGVFDKKDAAIASQVLNAMKKEQPQPEKKAPRCMCKDCMEARGEM